MVFPVPALPLTKIVEFNFELRPHSEHQPGVSALLRIKNESSLIERVLSSIHGVFDEIVVIDNEQVFSSKFKKRDFVIKTKDGNYDQFLKFQLVNDRCDLIDKYKAGQEITVHFNLSGRGYDKGGDTVYFTNLVATGGGGKTKPLKLLVIPLSYFF